MNDNYEKKILVTQKALTFGWCLFGETLLCIMSAVDEQGEAEPPEVPEAEEEQLLEEEECPECPGTPTVIASLTPTTSSLVELVREL